MKTDAFRWSMFFVGNFLTSICMCVGVELFNFKKIFPFFGLKRSCGLTLLMLSSVCFNYIPCFTEAMKLTGDYNTSIIFMLYVSFGGVIVLFIGSIFICYGISLFNFKKIFPFFTFKRMISIYLFIIGVKFATYGMFFHHPLG